MRDIVPRLREWERQGKRYALATLIKVDRSAPKPAGAAMALCEDGTVAGSVSGGCVESALHEEAAAVLAGGPPKTVTYGITDAEGFDIGLACGGQLHLFVDAPMFPTGLLEAIESNQPVALATTVTGPHAGARTLESAQGRVDGAVLREDPEETVFIQTFAPAADMYVFGAADFSAAVASMGRFLGYQVTVIDPRPVFATKDRFPDAHQVVVAWPDAFLAKAPIGPSTAIVILTHDPKFDIPALTRALRTEAGYIGAMGARKTNEARFAKLREAGLSDEQLARIHAPIGLDIGGRNPQETAVSIAAEIIAWRSGRQGALS